jgi:PrtD family type I secretion system ABC transporter
MKKPRKIKQPDYIKPYFAEMRRTAWYLALFSALILIFSLSMPLYFQAVLNDVLSTRSARTLVMITIPVIFASLMLCLFQLVRKNILLSAGQWLEDKIAPSLLSIAVHKQSVGIPISISDGQRELEIIKDFITNSISILLDIPFSVLLLIYIYFSNQLIGTILIIVSILLVLMNIFNEKIVRPILNKSKENLNNHYAISEAASLSAESIEAMGMMPRFFEIWNKNRIEIAENRRKTEFYSIIFDTITHVIPMVLRLFMLAVMSYLTMTGNATVGNIMFYMILGSIATSPFRKADRLYKSWNNSKSAYKKINNIIAAEQVLKRTSYQLPEPTGVLSLENVVYSHHKAITPVIKGISFQLPAGASLSIIGPAAAGKSTLSKLIIGTIAPTHGSVRIDGAETYQWERGNFGKYTGYMPQNIELFSGSVKDNIARMNKDASMESVIEAAKLAHCHGMIMKLPQGYDTMIEPNGFMISPGQKQRICLARALYGNPKFVLLDEPNINLDEMGEKALLTAIENIKQAGITLVVIAHRPQIVANLEYMLVLKNGLIERIGATNDVINLYREKN